MVETDVLIKIGLVLLLLLGAHVYVEIKARRAVKNTVYMVRPKKN
jgi:hypothetical protein